MKMDTTNWEAPDVIARQCSAGTILRGVLHTMDKDVYKITPRQLVKVPNKLELLEPLIGVKDHEHASCIIKQRAKLHNKHQLDAFEQSFLKSEISLDAEFNIKGLSNWAGNCKKRQEKADNQAKKTKKETKFYSEASYTMLAVARMHVEKEIKLELSDDASDALYYIHQQDIATKKWKKNNKRRHLYNLCSDFFRDFGTHFNYGVFHLGGIIITSVTFEGDTESSMDTIKKAVSASLDACENVGFSETVSAKWLKEHVNTSGNFEERDFKNIRVVCQQYGGFPITKTFTENDWMEDLRKESVNWVVINRGYSKDVGVWELLPEDGFDDRKLFLYENLFKFHSTYLYRDQMYRIMATGTGPESILNALRDMTDKTETREKTDGVTKEWLHLLLDDRNVAKFLLTTERYSQDLATKDLDVIEQILDQLLGYVGGNDFEDKGKVYQLKENIKNMSLRRTSVKKLLAKEKDPKQDIEQYLEELLEKVSSLSAVEWARILREDAKICREDATVTDYLLNSLTGKTVAETIDDETRSKIKDLVNELVDCAGQETFPNKDEIEKVRKHNIEKELIAKD